MRTRFKKSRARWPERSDTSAPPTQLSLPLDGGLTDQGAFIAAHAENTSSRETAMSRAGPSPAVPQTASAHVTAPAAPSPESYPDELLHMRDIVRITHRHRATIYRHIRLKLFPEQRMRNGKKMGWARSDIESWLQGDPSPKR